MEPDITRRSWLSRAGVGGFGALALGKGTVEAAVPRATAGEFGYSFRTFGPGETIRVGMIGDVGHTGVILGDIPKIPNLELAAYSNRSNRNQALPPGVREYETFEEMFDREELNIAGVCLPYSLNAGAAIAAAEKGCHVITEKPIATTLDDLERLRRTVKEKRVRLTSLHVMRIEPRFQAVYDAVGKGLIGEPILTTAQKSYKFGKSRPEFYKDYAMYGGTIPWVGIHAIDYVHYTTRLDYTRVAAFQGNLDHADYPGCQDFAGIIFGTSNGGTAMINMDYLRPETAPTHGDDRLRIIGSEGVVEIKDLGARVELITSSSGPVDLPYPEERSFMADFVAELRGTGKHVIAPEEPFEMTRVALLARQAAETGTVIEL